MGGGVPKTTKEKAQAEEEAEKQRQDEIAKANDKANRKSAAALQAEAAQKVADAEKVLELALSAQIELEQRGERLPAWKPSIEGGCMCDGQKLLANCTICRTLYKLDVDGNVEEEEEDALEVAADSLLAGDFGGLDLMEPKPKDADSKPSQRKTKAQKEAEARQKRDKANEERAKLARERQALAQKQEDEKAQALKEAETRRKVLKRAIEAASVLEVATTAAAHKQEQFPAPKVTELTIFKEEVSSQFKEKNSNSNCLVLRFDHLGSTCKLVKAVRVAAAKCVNVYMTRVSKGSTLSNSLSDNYTNALNPDKDFDPEDTDACLEGDRDLKKYERDYRNDSSSTEKKLRHEQAKSQGVARKLLHQVLVYYALNPVNIGTKERKQEVFIFDEELRNSIGQTCSSKDPLMGKSTEMGRGIGKRKGSVFVTSCSPSIAASPPSSH